MACFLCHRRSYAAKRDASFINEVWCNHVGQSGHYVLAPAFDGVSKPGNCRERCTCERFKEVSVAKTVTKGEIRSIVQLVIDAHVKAVVIVTLSWRRYKILKWHVPIWQGIKSSNCAADGVDEEIRNCSILEWLAKRIIR